MRYTCYFFILKRHFTVFVFLDPKNDVWGTNFSAGKAQSERTKLSKSMYCWATHRICSSLNIIICGVEGKAVSILFPQHLSFDKNVILFIWQWWEWLYSLVSCCIHWYKRFTWTIMRALYHGISHRHPFCQKQQPP